MRNEVIESLEMDRRREAEEDQVSAFLLNKIFPFIYIRMLNLLEYFLLKYFQSIKEQLELHTAKRDEELCQQTPVKLSKKEKKKQKESKKLAKQKKMDADKVNNCVKQLKI